MFRTTCHPESGVQRTEGGSVCDSHRERTAGSRGSSSGATQSSDSCNHHGVEPVLNPWPGAVARAETPTIELDHRIQAEIPTLRRYLARGYDLATDRLRVVRGLMFHSDTVVPFGRVQHIDVDQGPIERYYGIATLTLHTAGSHNSSVALPGIGHDDALAMRETIRAAIKRDSM